MKNRLIIIAYRLPFSVKKVGKVKTLVQNSGGLVSAVLSLAQNLKKDKKADFEDKISWYGAVEKKKGDLPLEPFESENFIAHPVLLEKGVNERFYEGLCNGTIWPLFHYFPSLTSYETSTFEAYEMANRKFFEVIRPNIRNGDTIWIHDYHLFLLPKMIRSEFPDAKIGFFLHIPFPSYELYRLLPKAWGEQMLEGILGADLVGFHTNDYAQHFLNTTRRILGYDNNLRNVKTDDRIVKVDAFPISIDFQQFNNAYDDEQVILEREKINKYFSKRDLVFSVDRLDYSKGLMNRLEGYESFLENNPEWHEKISFLMVVVPSRDSIGSYLEMKSELEEAIGRINGKYARFNWILVNYQYRSLNFHELIALYTASDIALITPVRDGMNLVAKEFIASRKNLTGVLILSEMTGAASELGEAIVINPTDRQAIGEAIKKALEMPVKEQMYRMEKMQERIKNYDVFRWAGDFFSQIEYIKRHQKAMNVNLVTKEILTQIHDKFYESKKRLLLFDYDGTLVPFNKFPTEAKPSEKVLELLDILAKDERNDLVIVSGRDKDSLENWLGHLPIKIVAEHGAITKIKDIGWVKLENINTSWKSTIRPVLEKYVYRCNASFIEEKETSLAWHYRNSNPEFAFIRSRELLEELSEISADISDIMILEGNKVIEIKSNFHNKGTAASKILLEDDYDFILAAGDDKTDEDLFRVLPESAYSIKVGAEPSIARFNVKAQKNMIACLEFILENEIKG